MNVGIRLAEAGLLPDPVLRRAIRHRHARVLEREDAGTAEGRQESMRGFMRIMAQSPVAITPEAANRQHYEVPPELFRLMLGPYLKYSACLWPDAELGGAPRGKEPERERQLLAAAEEAMLALTAERALLEGGQRILDLGCGWGSFSLWAAQRYPEASILAVSNSAGQIGYIEQTAKTLGLHNLRAHKSDMNEFAPPDGEGPFDRIVSVEMFEHMRNWAELLRRISGWLTQDGRLFVHVFAHREIVYPFRNESGEWMSRHFFSGGMMPADSLMLHLQQDLILEDHWRLSGLHYARTLDSWLALLDSGRSAALNILAEAGQTGGASARVRFNRWRLFLLACSELFAFKSGNEWLVSHYRLARRRTA